MKVTLANAEQLRKEILEKEQQAASEDPLRPKVDDGSGTPVMRLNGLPPEDGSAADPGPDPGDGASAEGAAQPDDGQEPPKQDEATSDWERKYRDLEKKYNELDRNFRNIQRQITPVQQERARLREEVEALRKQIGEIPDKQREARAAKLRALEDFSPEAADLLREQEEELKALRERVAAPSNEPEDPSPNAMTRIFSHHRDITPETLAKDVAFWAYVDAQPGSEYAREVLSNPGAFFEGAEFVIDLVQGFKDSRSQAAAPGRPSKPSVERPTNIQPSTAKTSVPPVPGARPPAPTREQILARGEELRREVRRATPARCAEIRKELGEMERLLMAGAGS